jgi:diguanylate cyclase (GGDEF)-like protein
MEKDTGLIKVLKHKVFGDSEIIDITEISVRRAMLFLTIFVGIIMSISFSLYNLNFVVQNEIIDFCCDACVTLECSSYCAVGTVAVEHSKFISTLELFLYLSLILLFIASSMMLSRRSRVPIAIPTMLVTIPLIIVFVGMFFVGGKEGFRGIWILCIPLISVLMGLKNAVIVNTSVFFVISAIAFIPGFGYDYLLGTSVRYLTAYFINCIFTFAYEYSRNKSHYRHVRELKLLGQIDPLTGLLNRRGFQQNFEMLWKQAVREKLPISFLMIDVDHFKKFNDTYGHPQGDICLIQCVGIFKKCVKRPLDLIVRLGGEEFGILLFNTKLKEAVSLAEEIRLEVEKSVVKISENITTNVTVSIGIASTFGNIEKTLDEIYIEADTYLYDAKLVGRNQVIYFKG